MLGYTLALLHQLLTQENNGSFQIPPEPKPNFLQKPIFTPSSSNTSNPEYLDVEPPDFIMDEDNEGIEKENNQPVDSDNLNEQKNDNLDFVQINLWA